MSWWEVVGHIRTLKLIAKEQHAGQWDDSVGEGDGYQEGRSKFKDQKPHGGRIGRTLTTCPLVYTGTTHGLKIHKYFVIS